MYTNYNMPSMGNNMYNKNYYPDNDDRFGILGPLLLGGIAGYAIGSPGGFGRPCCPPPVYYPPMYPSYPAPIPYQSNNFYYRR